MPHVQELVLVFLPQCQKILTFFRNHKDAGEQAEPAVHLRQTSPCKAAAPPAHRPVLGACSVEGVGAA